MVHLQTIIVDNGGHTMKVGSANNHEPRMVPNCIVKAKNERKRVYVGEELCECADRSSLFFVLPFEKGYLDLLGCISNFYAFLIVNWDVEQQVWDHAFTPYPAEECRIVLSDPNYLVPAVRDLSDEILFEHFGFQSVFKSSAAGLIALNSAHRNCRCSLVVDCGFSCTYIAPFIDGKVIQEAVIRLDVGGKALTNQLKEWISYRELNVMEETYVMNECKEDSCYVTLDFQRDVNIARFHDSRNTIRREYVLPDFVTHQRGFLREVSREKDNAQYLSMNMERFALPEALFRPSDIGIDQMGIVEAVIQSISRCPGNLRAALLRNISIVGGSSMFPGFKDRFIRDLRAGVCREWDVSLVSVGHPITHAWNCGRDVFENDDKSERFVTRAEWEEYGDVVCREKFYYFLKS